MTTPTPTVALLGQQEPFSVYLPPQTTPFVYTGPDCTPYVYCAGLTSVSYSSPGQQIGGAPCFGVHTVPNPRAPLVPFMGYNNQCFPGNFYELFGDQRKQAVYDWPHGTQEGARSTLAYPGTVCPWLWTTACTKTLTHEGLHYPQAWCCPPGKWNCASELGGPADPQRLCRSVVSELTEVWMSFDPAFTLRLNGDETYTWHAQVAGVGEVYHRVFPLSLSTGVAPRDLAQTNQAPVELIDSESTTVSHALNVSHIANFGRLASFEPSLASYAIISMVLGAVALGCVGGWLSTRNKRGRQDRSLQMTSKPLRFEDEMCEM